MGERGQTNVDFAFAGLALTIFVSATLLVPASPLFSFTNTDIDHQIEAEATLVQTETKLEDGGEITTNEVCDIANNGVIADSNLNYEIDFATVGGQANSHLESRLTESSCSFPVGDTRSSITTDRYTLERNLIQNTTPSSGDEAYVFNTASFYTYYEGTNTPSGESPINSTETGADGWYLITEDSSVTAASKTILVDGEQTKMIIHMWSENN